MFMALVVASLFLGGCKEETQGTITVYTAMEHELATEFLQAFNAKYPDIKVNITRESTGIITSQIIAEKDNPQADVVWGTAASSMLVLDELRMLEGYSPKGIDRILPKFKSDKLIPTWVGINARETAFIVNAVELSKLGLQADEVKSFNDLLRPELKGRIAMPNPSSSGTGFFTIAGILQLNGKDTEKGWNYLSKLHENIGQYVHAGSEPAKMAAAGECVVGISFGYAGIRQRKNGAPVLTIFPIDGSGWDMEANALIKKKNINSAAKTFLDWAISDEAMDLYKNNYPIISTGKGGSYEGFNTDPIHQLIDNDFAWVASNRESILNKFLNKILNAP